MRENNCSKKFKMYKSGKTWCLAAITTFLVIGMNTVVAHADSGVVNGDANQTKVDSGSNVTQSQTSNNDTNQSSTTNQKSVVATTAQQTTTATQQTANTTQQATAVTQQTNVESASVNPVIGNTSAKSSLNFDDTQATSAYLQKDAQLFSDSEGTNVIFTVTDSNVEILAQSTDVNKRLLVKIKSNNVVGYVDQNSVNKQPQVVNNDNGVSHYTRADMNAIPDALKNSSVWAPTYDSTNLSKDLTNVVQYNATTGQNETQKVWDSWPVENTDGTVANYHGYHLVVGLTAPANADWYYAKMGLFAQKISSESSDISSWSYLGNVFNQFGEGQNASTNDAYLSKMLSEWSGSTVLLNNEDQSLRFFYTNFSTAGQVLTTAQVFVSPKDGQNWDSGLTIDHTKTTDHKTVFVGDGNFYQNESQSGGKLTTALEDEVCLRDPHLVYSDGQPYLVFEGNTGSSTGFQGTDNLYNQAYFGTSGDSFNSDQSMLNNSANRFQYEKAYFANAALGLLKLNNDFTVATVEKPLITANGVTDELERPNLFEYQGKWYLFTATHGWHMASDNARITHGQNGAADYMLGFVSDDGIMGHYKPLNGNGLVLATDQPATTNYVYSFLVLKNSDSNSNRFVVTSYVDGKTFAPSFIMEINGDTTKIINDRVLDQGALVESESNVYPAQPQKDGLVSGYYQDALLNGFPYRWYENNLPFTGFKWYDGTYYWFDQGNRMDNAWHENSVGKFYTGADGRSYQGMQSIDGNFYYFGDDGSYYLRTNQYVYVNGQKYYANSQGVLNGDWTGYIYDGSAGHDGYRWYQDGQLFTGFRWYAGTYYWFDNGERMDNSWHENSVGKFYSGADGRTYQGLQAIDGNFYYFGGDDGSYYLRTNQNLTIDGQNYYADSQGILHGDMTGYIYDGSTGHNGYRWYQDGQLFTGFRWYAGTYYWFDNGERMDNAWHENSVGKFYSGADGRTYQGLQSINGNLYYFGGDDGSYYLRTNQDVTLNGILYHADDQGILNGYWTGYIYDGSAGHDGYRWYQDGQLFTGFRWYAGTYYWFDNGERMDNAWHENSVGKFYSGADGRTYQGLQAIDGNFYYFGGDDGSYYLRTNQNLTIDGQNYYADSQGILHGDMTGYIYDGSTGHNGYRWYQDGQLFTGFRWYAGTYYWFNNGERMDNAWHENSVGKFYSGADGRTYQGLQSINGNLYYFGGDDGSYYLRTNQDVTLNGILYHADNQGILTE
ncbi:glycoside hydrolase family 68 protein [Fructobacillus tropaeoli]|uniref:glycoside hydrolase family 68 protein n=1 Tax=Fructobacillus tropaeoli TaxID=709323 RepID=UPI002D8CE57A|nr:Glucan-binding domain (YG repeat) [Fructobacillus tropaeoli]